MIYHSLDYVYPAARRGLSPRRSLCRSSDRRSARSIRCAPSSITSRSRRPHSCIDRRASSPTASASSTATSASRYGEFLDRCLRFAGALRELGVQPGDRVAVLAGNSHVLLAAHYAVPFAGAVLVALNTRITPADIAFIVGHAGASVLIYDPIFADAATQAACQVGAALELVRAGGSDDRTRAVDRRRPAVCCTPSPDERSLLAINYTSGTTAQPKGVMYHHRGAYLQALAMALHMGLTGDSVYLWTLPMFHCNGWCFPWAVTATGGVHLCLPKLEAGAIWRHLRESGVTHFCAAPTVLTMTAWDPGRAQAAAARARRDRRCAAHARAARAARRARHGHHASLWTHRDVRAIGHLRLAQRMERAADRGAGAAQGAAGGRERHRRACPRRGRAAPMSRATRRRWARSRSAATT